MILQLLKKLLLSSLKLSKIHFTLFFLLLFFSSCKDYTVKQYCIQGSNLKEHNNKKVYLLKEDNDLLTIKLDSTIVLNSGFFFKGNFDEPELRFITIEGESEKLPVLLEEDVVEIYFNGSSIFNSVVKKGIENKYLFDYNLKALKINDEIKNFKRSNSLLMQKSKENNDKRVIDSLLKIHYDLNFKHIINMNNHLLKHPNSYVSLMLVDGLFDFPNYPIADIERHFNNFDSNYRKYRIAERIKVKIDSIKNN